MFGKCAKCFWVCCRLWFCSQDLRSWIVAILQDSMPSVITHLLGTFKNFMFFSWYFAFQLGAVVKDSATATPRVVSSEKQPAAHVFNLQTNVWPPILIRSRFNSSQIPNRQQRKYRPKFIIRVSTTLNYFLMIIVQKFKKRFMVFNLFLWRFWNLGFSDLFLI